MAMKDSVGFEVSGASARSLEALEQAGHAIDFFTGDSRMLRDRIARALPAWEAGDTGFHAVLGMHAFGLEETGDYARAEAQGRKSVELEPRDVLDLTLIEAARRAGQDNLAAALLAERVGKLEVRAD